MKKIFASLIFLLLIESIGWAKDDAKTTYVKSENGYYSIRLPQQETYAGNDLYEIQSYKIITNNDDELDPDNISNYKLLKTDGENIYSKDFECFGNYLGVDNQTIKIKASKSYFYSPVVGVMDIGSSGELNFQQGSKNIVIGKIQINGRPLKFKISKLTDDFISLEYYKYEKDIVSSENTLSDLSDNFYKRMARSYHRIKFDELKRIINETK